MTDEQYEDIQAKIVELQNENYADPLALYLQEQLGMEVLRDYYASLRDEDEVVWLDE